MQGITDRQIQETRAILLAHPRVVITSHVNPDGDSLGSELALARALLRAGRDVAILNHNETPENYRWMDTDGLIRRYIPDRDNVLISQAGLIVIVDTNQPDRLRSMEHAVVESRAVKVVIDHHLEPHPFAGHYLIDTEATSTGEILFRLIGGMPGVSIDRPIAEALYTAIMTDTGSFRYPRTDPETHRITAELIGLGADPVAIFSQVYENWTAGRMRLLGEVLDTMKTLYDGKLAYVVCTRAMFEATGTSEVDTDNFTVYPMSIRGVMVGILFNELKDGVKISFRSKGSIPINGLAREFGGNGHLNAAGARLFNAELEPTIRQVLNRAAGYVNGTRTENS